MRVQVCGFGIHFSEIHEIMVFYLARRGFWFKCENVLHGICSITKLLNGLMVQAVISNVY